MTLREWVVRWGWILPLLALTLLIGGTLYLDRQVRNQLESRREAAAAQAEREASTLAEAIAAEVAGRIGALAAARLQFTQVEDSLSRRTFMAAVDSAIAGVAGLEAISVIYPDGRLVSSRTAALSREPSPLNVPQLNEAYGRALDRRTTTATPVLRFGGTRRVVVFEPVARSDTAAIQAVLAAELEPLPILRAALDQERGRLGPAFYDLFDPAGSRITTVPAPEGWPSVRRPIRVADTEWSLFVAHQPVSERMFTATAVAIRVAGGLLAVSLAITLLLLWRMVVAQQREIRLRRAAESQARSLSEQLRSAQEGSLRLSGAMDPDRVVEEFLGSVGLEIGADVGRLYDFEDNGEVVVGRRLVVLSPRLAEVEGLDEESFRQVRSPATLMPHMADAVASGEPRLETDADAAGRVAEANEAGPSTSLIVPLAMGGHLVGVAVWESYTPGHAFDERAIPFAQAVAAHAAAALRTAELMEGVRQARQRAQKEAGRLATVLDQLGDGVVLFDAEGRPERVNPAAEALLGAALHETTLDDWPRVFGLMRSDAAGSPDFAAAALAGRTVRDARITLRKGGVERYLATSAAPIRGPDGRTRGASLVLHDITAEHEYAKMLRHTNDELRRQAELLERTNDDLRAATAAKDQFLAMMSHELRTPINAIIGYSEILSLGVHGDLGERQRWMLGRVQETSRHLLGLIEDVLDLAKIGAGRISVDMKEVELGELVGRAVAQIAPLAAEKDLDIRRERGDGTRVLADDTRLLQILINLCSNAVKFTDSGSITVRVGRADRFALVAVIDTGPGIPADQLETIFEEFHQLDNGLARKVGGSGLGLTISRRLARLMGGDITVTSQVGEGTTFTVRIPLADRRTLLGAPGRPGGWREEDGGSTAHPER